MLESSAVFKLCKYKLHPVRSDLKIFPEKKRRKFLIQISFGSIVFGKNVPFVIFKGPIGKSQTGSNLVFNMLFPFATAGFKDSLNI